MKKQNYFMIFTMRGFEIIDSTMRKTEKGMSNHANKMFKKFGEDITVEVYQCTMYEDDMHLYATYHA